MKEITEISFSKQNFFYEITLIKNEIDYWKIPLFGSMIELIVSSTIEVFNDYKDKEESSSEEIYHRIREKINKNIKTYHLDEELKEINIDETERSNLYLPDIRNGYSLFLSVNTGYDRKDWQYRLMQKIIHTMISSLDKRIAKYKNENGFIKDINQNDPIAVLNSFSQKEMKSYLRIIRKKIEREFI